VGFLDKVKEQAAVATAVAKDAAQKGQAKIDDYQAKRDADALLRDLGAAAYAEQTGRGTATAATDVEQLIAKLQAYEEAHGPIDLTPSASRPDAPDSPGAGYSGS
jgi:hypothetical protein